MTITLQPRKVSFGTSGSQKYRAKPTVVDGIKFPSKKEAKRWGDLQLLEKAGRIRLLTRQPKFDLVVNAVLIGRYTGDFRYEELQHGVWVDVVEDVKGHPSRDYPLRKKLMMACHAIAIRET